MLRHVGCHSSRRPESLSGRKFVIILGDSRFQPGLLPSLIGQYAPGTSFVPLTPRRWACFLRPASRIPGNTIAIGCGKLSISHLCYLNLKARPSGNLSYRRIQVTDIAQPVPVLQTFKLTLAYDGTDFKGWQVQPGEITVQGELQAALGRITGEEPLPQGSGRTDAGVHALGQVASFALQAPIPPANLQRALNRTLPASIRVIETLPVPNTFHARHSAVAKTYEYRVFRGQICPPVLARYVHACPWPMDMASMNQAAHAFLGQHDFLSFAATDPDLANRTAFADSYEKPDQPLAVRTIYSSCWEERQNEAGPLVVYRVRGSGFLHHMVRNLVGTMLDVGRGRLNPDLMPGILAARARAAAGPTAPAQGLFLHSVEYSVQEADGASD